MRQLHSLELPRWHCCLGLGAACHSQRLYNHHLPQHKKMLTALPPQSCPLQNYWNANRRKVPRTLAAMLSGKPNVDSVVSPWLLLECGDVLPRHFPQVAACSSPRPPAMLLAYTLTGHGLGGRAVRLVQRPSR